MEPILADAAADQVARSQLRMFASVCEQAGLAPEDRRHLLQLAPETWQAWESFLSGGSRPTVPPLPEMLLHLAEIAFSTCLAEVCPAAA